MDGDAPDKLSDLDDLSALFFVHFFYEWLLYYHCK